jgi:hypothetical protein
VLQTHNYIILSYKKSESFPLRSEARQGCPQSPHVFSTVVEILARAIRQQKTKDIQIVKEQVQSSHQMTYLIYRRP